MKPPLCSLAIVGFTLLHAWSGSVLAQTAAGSRHALILCNQNYAIVGALKTPLAEAKEAEKTLAALGFAGNITVVTDATTSKMIETVDTFAAKLTKADVALFFYGGHAVQVAGENYLLGVDSDPATASQLAYKALPLGRVLTNLEGSGARLNLLILDCCRDNPLPASGRSIGSTRGLAAVASAPKGTFIAYAADANQQAWDDHGSIGLYGSVLFEKMKTPGLRLEDIFIQTREEVAKIATEKYKHQQEPAEYSKVSGAFYFVPATYSPTFPKSENTQLLAGTSAGQVWENSQGTAFRWCPSGEFWMGSSEAEKKMFARDEVETNDETRHKVKLTNGFWLSQNEVTQGEWETIMNTKIADQALRKGNDGQRWQIKLQNGILASWERKDSKNLVSQSQTSPMYFVSWIEARTYCEKLTEIERKNSKFSRNWCYKLPTEAQWEYACRAGTETSLFVGNLTIEGVHNASVLDPIAWYGGNSNQGYSEVGVDCTEWAEKQYPGRLAGVRHVGYKKPNPWGLYDMIGNVSEWTADWYSAQSSVGDNAPATNPERTIADDSFCRVLRGGDWRSTAAACRSAFRNRCNPDYRSNALGFRPALVPSDQ